MKHSLERFATMRAELCELAEKKKLMVLKNEYKEIKVFLELYKLKGPDCAYMLGVCELISLTPELMKRIEELKK